MLLSTHYIACVYWWTGRMSLEWGYEESWIHNSKLDLLEDGAYSMPEKYIKCFYFSIAQISSVGFGDIHPINAIEELVCCIAIVLGTCFFAWFVGAVSQMITEGDAVRAAEDHKIAEGRAFCVSKVCRCTSQEQFYLNVLTKAKSSILMHFLYLIY